MATKNELQEMKRLIKEIELMLIAEIQSKINDIKAKTEVMRAEREAMEEETVQLHASNEAMKLSLNAERSKSIH